MKDEHDSIRAVYELRDAAMEHGKAIAALEREATPDAIDAALDTKIVLETKTAFAIDECAENAEVAADEAREVRS